MVVGGTYGLSLPLWGYLCDSTLTRNSPKFVEVIGAILIAGGFLVLGKISAGTNIMILTLIAGPFKYLPFKKTLVTIIIGMTIHGFGLGASVVGGFADAHKSAIKCGFPDTIDTYGLVSGLWTSVFAFGAFVGGKTTERIEIKSMSILHLQAQHLVVFYTMPSPSDGQFS